MNQKITKTHAAIAKQNGIPRTTFLSRIKRGWDIQRAATTRVRSKRECLKDKVFALYKGDKLLAIGTLDEIAEQLNISNNTVLFYGTEGYKRVLSKRKNINNCRELVELDDED